MDLLVGYFPVTVALAAAAALGYVAGRRTGSGSRGKESRFQPELCRTEAFARELEKIAAGVRRNLAQHHASLIRLKQRVNRLNSEGEEASSAGVSQEAAQMLAPTLELAAQIANACDLICQQTNHLTSLTEVRTDPLTGVSNRRGLEEALAAQFLMSDRYEAEFSVAIFDVDRFRRIDERWGLHQGDRLLKRAAALLHDTARQTDVVARYADGTFAVVMPQTGLEEASSFAERVRAKVEQELPITVSGGVATVLDGDTADSLLARADTALDAAKSAGGNGVFRHDGRQTESIWEDMAAGQD